MQQLRHNPASGQTGDVPAGALFRQSLFFGHGAAYTGLGFSGLCATYYLAGVSARRFPVSLSMCTALLFLLDPLAGDADCAGIGRPSGYASSVRHTWVFAGLLHGDPRCFGRHQFAGPRLCAARLDSLTFYVIPITDMAIFATLIFFAFRNRFDPSGHKRFILIATIALLIAAIARWPFTAFLGTHRRYPVLLRFFCCCWWPMICGLSARFIAPGYGRASFL